MPSKIVYHQGQKQGSEISVAETFQLLEKREPVVLLDIRRKKR